MESLPNIWADVLMQKAVNNRIINVRPKGPQLWSLLLVAFSLLLIVIGALGLLYVQQPLREESFDTRRDASVANGPVEISTTFAGPTSNNNEGQVKFNFNSQGLPVTKMELVFNIITPVFSQAADEAPVIHADFPGSSTRITDQEMEKTSDGYLVSLVVEPRQGTSLATTETKTFAVLDFVAKSSGSLSIPFDPNASKVFVSGNPTTDQLKHVTTAAYTVTVAQAEQPADSLYFVDNQIDTRFYRTDGTEISVYALQENQNYRAKTTYQVQNTRKNMGASATNNKEVMVVLNTDGRDRQSKERPYTDLTSSANGFTDVTEYDYTPTSNLIPIKLSLYMKESTPETATTNQAITTLYDTWTITYNLGGTGGVSDVKSCNERCDDNSECPTNHRCYEDRCRLVTNLSSSSCSAPPDNGLQRTCNQYCADTQECAAGFSCHFNRCRRPDNIESTTCSVPSATLQQAIRESCNDSCQNNAGCANNMRCYNGQCRLATNPGSTSCTAATQPVVSTKYYSTGGNAPTKGAAGSTATGSARPATTSATTRPATRSAQATPAAGLVSPFPTPAASPMGDAIVRVSPSPVAVPEPEGNFFQRLTQSGISFPLIALALGILILIAVGIMALVNLLKKRSGPGGPPGSATLKQKTPYEAELQERIEKLKSQQAQGPGVTPPPVSSAPQNAPPPKPNSDPRAETQSAPPSTLANANRPAPAPEKTRPTEPPATPKESPAEMAPPPSTLRSQPPQPMVKPATPPQEVSPQSAPSSAPTSMMERIRQKGINPPDTKPISQPEKSSE